MNANNAINVFKNIVGVEVATIQDVVKAQSAGLYITGKDGWGYDYDIEDEEDGEKVYACMTLANDLCVTKDTNTTCRVTFLLIRKYTLCMKIKL